MRRERFGKARIERRVRATGLVELTSLSQPLPREYPHCLQHADARLPVRTVPDAHEADVGKLRDTVEGVSAAAGHRRHGRQVAAAGECPYPPEERPQWRAQQVVAPGDGVAQRPLACWP